MASGIQVNDEGVMEFQKMKGVKTDGSVKKPKLLIYMISKDDATGKDQIKIDDDLQGRWKDKAAQDGEELPSIRDFLLHELSDCACRYIFVDRAIKKGDLTEKYEMKMLTWAPDSAKMREKMLIASSKVNFKKSIGYTPEDSSCSDKSELEENLEK